VGAGHFPSLGPEEQHEQDDDDEDAVEDDAVRAINDDSIHISTPVALKVRSEPMLSGDEGSEHPNIAADETDEAEGEDNDAGEATKRS
jgi:hypothetical protein